MRGQIALYESTAGAYGGTFGGHPVVILTTTGAKTGKARKVPVMRVEHRGVYVAVAFAGGSSHHPQWYYSLLAYRECSSRTETRSAGCTPARCSGPRRSDGGRSPTHPARTTPLPRHRGA
jgi:deazaflavin-dependent oxidoreductase (nitroreductase family)